ncbi:hypothetical protein PR048_008544 [Dryococelus australis]|uniref:Uncharacterized protein n=1 Tax=Dryococelus australis TaxID=614101 RepID=A0ABQ9HXE1_9NEOP|nr:hypothetical protein PR048_008544 [Dryococelus australis]
MYIDTVVPTEAEAPPMWIWLIKKVYILYIFGVCLGLLAFGMLICCYCLGMKLWLSRKMKESEVATARHPMSENFFGRGKRSAGFLKDLPFAPLLHSDVAPNTPRFTLIGSQDLDACVVSLPCAGYERLVEKAPEEGRIIVPRERAGFKVSLQEQKQYREERTTAGGSNRFGGGMPKRSSRMGKTLEEFQQDYNEIIKVPGNMTSHRHCHM